MEYQKDKNDISEDPLVRWVSMFRNRNGNLAGDPDEDYLSCLRLIAACKDGCRFLSVGTSDLRVLDIVRPFAARIVFLEPDKELFLGFGRGLGGQSTTSVFNMDTSGFRKSFAEEKFEVVIAPMVLQHVSTETCHRILRDIGELLTPSGVAVISSSHLFEERFIYQGDPTPRNAAEFDRYAETPADQAWGRPVRMFTRGSFLYALDLAKLEVVVWNEFFYAKPAKVTTVAGLLNVPPSTLRDSGLSQFAVVRRGRA